MLAVLFFATTLFSIVIGTQEKRKKLAINKVAREEKLATPAQSTLVITWNKRHFGDFGFLQFSTALVDHDIGATFVVWYVDVAHCDGLFQARAEGSTSHHPYFF